jgi:Fungal pheromone mating factor STE2 GPCR
MSNLTAFPTYEFGQPFAVPPNFDPLTQPLWWLLQNGTIYKPFTFNDLDRFTFRAAQWSVVYGATIGAGVMTLLHVLALTPLTKRRTLIYWLNVIGLCLVVARGIIQTLFFTRDKFQTHYIWYSEDSTTVPALHRFHSTLSVILSVASIMVVEIIFFVQGRAILSSLPRQMYLALISILVLFGLVAVTVRIIYAVYNLQDIWVWNLIAVDTSAIPDWCEPTSKVTCAKCMIHQLT